MPKGRIACLQDVEAIVDCAVRHQVCLIPFGGGTSVTGGLAVPHDEKRMVATVSLSFMQRILSLDRDALLLSVEAGAVGIVLEEQLRRLGVTLGHEPDSFEFSTVGGWVATRASGKPLFKAAACFPLFGTPRSASSALITVLPKFSLSVPWHSTVT